MTSAASFVVIAASIRRAEPAWLLKEFEPIVWGVFAAPKNTIYRAG